MKYTFGRRGDELKLWYINDDHPKQSWVKMYKYNAGDFGYLHALQIIGNRMNIYEGFMKELIDLVMIGAEEIEKA